MDARETVLRDMDEQVYLLNVLAIFAETSGLPGPAAAIMQGAGLIERSAALEREANERERRAVCPAVP